MAVRASRIAWLIFLITVCAASPSTAQTGPAGLQQVSDDLRELRALVALMREELIESRRESEALRRDVQALRERLEPFDAVAAGPGQPATTLETVAQNQALLAAKVDDHEQTKVESGSKYHVRLSGLALINIVGTRGSVDSLDVPAVAVPPDVANGSGAFTSSVRQSSIELEVFGPMVGGARTSGAVAFDFFGGFPPTPDGLTTPGLRLKTATFTMDWKRTTVVAGQEAPFFSPKSPTSLAQTAYPAFSYSGNLWAWTPQVHIERRFSVGNQSSLSLRGGILDPLTGEIPLEEYARLPTAGERSGIPAFAGRVGWLRDANNHLVDIGAGAYYANHEWPADTVHAWAVTSDWNVPVGRWLSVSGELYRGRGLSGLGGAVAPPKPPFGAGGLTSALLSRDTTGGWAQLKAKPTSRLEVNAAFGQDSPSKAGASGLIAAGLLERTAANRNASAFGNGIYQMRSNVLFSVEYRRLWTFGFDETRRTADQVSVTTGIAF